MKRYLIELQQECLIECDNPECDYTIKNMTGNPSEDIMQFVNKPCPMCGENLLTEEDYLQSEKTMQFINWINKWFSWLTVFIPSKKEQVFEIHINNGVKISEK